MTDTTTESASPVTPKKSKGLPVVAIVAIGCVGFLVIIGIIFTIVGKVLVSKMGTSLIQKGIESKTGLKVDTEKNSLSFTDKKTGETVNIGQDKIPDNFPKDFPIYPGSKFTGSLSGGNTKALNNGFWVVLTTPDSVTKVSDYYKTNLPKSGWTTDSNMTINNMVSLSVKKAKLAGAITISSDTGGKETTITVTLGTDTSDSQSSGTNSDVPTDEPTDTGAVEPSM